MNESPHRLDWPRQVNLSLGELMETTGWSKSFVRELRESGIIRAWRPKSNGNWRYITSSCRQAAEGMERGELR